MMNINPRFPRTLLRSLQELKRSSLDRAAEATGRYRVNKAIYQSISTYSVFFKTILQIVIDHHGVS